MQIIVNKDEFCLPLPQATLVAAHKVKIKKMARRKREEKGKSTKLTAKAKLLCF